MLKILASFPTCPIPEIARLGRPLNQRREAFLGYFTTAGANNGGTESINDLIKLARRTARGFRSPDNNRLRMLKLARRTARGFRNPDNYRLRMLLIGSGLRT
ncbi:transposase [Tessaracoccus defluvii]|uniref:transposase n=1 Tax=Tessaracoccus defluvii TaxID=1285901 RepID=UPI00338C8D39